MKRERHGRAKILTPTEIQLLFNEGLETPRLSQSQTRTGQRRDRLPFVSVIHRDSSVSRGKQGFSYRI